MIQIIEKRLWVCPECGWKNLAREDKNHINVCTKCKLIAKVKLNKDLEIIEEVKEIDKRSIQREIRQDGLCL